MQTLIILLSTFVIMTVTSGCTVLKSPSQDTITDATLTTTNKTTFGHPPLNVTEELLGAAQSIERSLGILAAAEKAENPPILNTETLIQADASMGRRVDVDWTGPLAPLIDKIAEMTQYHVKYLGNEPPIPILISIHAKRALIADVLQNTSLQAGKRALVLVFPDSRLIEVRYLS